MAPRTPGSPIISTRAELSQPILHLGSARSDVSAVAPRTDGVMARVGRCWCHGECRQSTQGVVILWPRHAFAFNIGPQQFQIDRADASGNFVNRAGEKKDRSRSDKKFFKILKEPDFPGLGLLWWFLSISNSISIAYVFSQIWV